jgi:hypothetical protein
LPRRPHCPATTHRTVPLQSSHAVPWHHDL